MKALRGISTAIAYSSQFVYFLADAINFKGILLCLLYCKSPVYLTFKHVSYVFFEFCCFQYFCNQLHKAMSVLKFAQYNIINYGIDIGNNFLGYAVLTRNWLWDAMIDLNTNTDCNWKIDLKPLKEWRAYSSLLHGLLANFFP